MKKLDLYIWEILMFALVGVDMITICFMAVFKYTSMTLTMVIILLNMFYLAWLYSQHVKKHIKNYDTNNKIEL